MGGEGPGLRTSPRAHLSIPQPLIPPSVHLPTAHPPHPATGKGKTWPSPPRTAENHPPTQLTGTQGAAHSLPPNPHRGLDLQGCVPAPTPPPRPGTLRGRTDTHPRRHTTRRHTHTNEHRSRHTRLHRPSDGHPTRTQTPNTASRAHILDGGGGTHTWAHNPRTHTCTQSLRWARTSPPEHSRRGSHSGAHTRTAGPSTSARQPAHTRMATQAAPHTPAPGTHRAARAHARPPQRRGHTLTGSRAHTRVHTGAPSRRLPGRCGPCSPSPWGPRAGPRRRRHLAPRHGGGRAGGGGAVPWGRLPPASRLPPSLPSRRRAPPFAPPAARAPPPPTLQGGEGAPTGPGAAADPSPLRSRRPAPDLSPAPPPAPPASRETPRPRPDWLGTRDLPTETWDPVPIPRGPQTMPSLPPLRIQNMLYSPSRTTNRVLLHLVTSDSARTPSRTPDHISQHPRGFNHLLQGH